MIKKHLRNIVVLPIIILAAGCITLSQKDPEVIVTTEPMLTNLTMVQSIRVHLLEASL